MIDELNECAVRHFPGALGAGSADGWFYAIMNDVHWVKPAMPRKTAWLTANGCQCYYGYSGHQIESAPFPIWMPALMKEVMEKCDVDSKDWPNSCNLNLYEDENNSVGWHADNEELFQGTKEHTRIISLSLGAPRTFGVKGNKHYRGPVSLMQVVLFNGDLLIMDGMAQKHLVHSVLKEDARTWPHKGQGPRINLTWRWTKKHRCDLRRENPAPLAQPSP